MINLNDMLVYQQEMAGDPEYRPYKVGDRVKLKRAKGNLEIERVEKSPGGNYDWYRCRPVNPHDNPSYRYYARHEELAFA